MKPVQQVAVLNAHYSANLGDGLLSDCLMYGLRNGAGDEVKPFPVDVAGRTEISTLGGNNRGKILKVLNALPTFLRTPLIRAIQFYFMKKKWSPHFEDHLSNCNALVVGGGNLIADQDLNFPTKIHGALKIAADKNLKCYLYGVGVGSHFSAKGLQLFRQAFGQADLRSVTVRDQKSKVNWDKYFSEATGKTAEIVWDPGVLASQCWPAERAIETSDKTRPIRVGIMSPNELSYHEGDKTLPDFVVWYSQLINGLRSSGHEVRLFSNGSPEDTRFLLEDILPEFSDIEYDIPEDQKALALLTGQSSLVLAFRLHAIIPAISYGVPAFALEWDPKVRSFMNRIGYGDRSLDVVKFSGQQVSEIALQAHGKTLNTPEFIEEALAQVNNLSISISNGAL